MKCPVKKGAAVNQINTFGNGHRNPFFVYESLFKPNINFHFLLRACPDEIPRPGPRLLVLNFFDLRHIYYLFRQRRSIFSKMDQKATTRKSKRHQKRARQCHCGKGTFMFCWTCRCGFLMCQACMYENQWGLTCNGITWECPDCGAQNGYGNQ